MVDYGLPVLVMLFAWWFSTGAILYLDGLPRATYRISFAAATLIAAVAAIGLVATADLRTPLGAYGAMFGALALWGLNEMAFLFGYVTGPERTTRRPGLKGLRSFVAAARTVIHHEIALVATGLAIVALTWGGENQLAAATFALLFAMRLSTKLNIFLGVPNTTIEFLPPHLDYLRSYFRQAPMNLLFPFSVTAATLLSAWLVHGLISSTGDAYATTAFTLLVTLAVLGLVEHWFLVVPLPVGRLWSWGLASRSQPAPAVPPRAGPLAPRRIDPVAKAAQPTLMA